MIIGAYLTSSLLTFTIFLKDYLSEPFNVLLKSIFFCNLQKKKCCLYDFLKFSEKPVYFKSNCLLLGVLCGFSKLILANKYCNLLVVSVLSFFSDRIYQIQRTRLLFILKHVLFYGDHF